MLADHAERYLISWAKWSIPRSKLTFLIATGVSWYGRRVMLTYGPGWLATYCIQATIRSTGNETMGRLIGATVVAPALVPDLMKPAIVITSISFWYLTVIIGNCVQKIFQFGFSKNKSPVPL